MSFGARLAGAFASNLFGYAVGVLVQLASVPVLVGVWGTSLYGEWLLVTTIPAYLAISDLGLGSAASNEMALHATRGDRDSTAAVFQSVGLAIFGFGPLLFLPAGLLLCLLPVEPLFGFSVIVGPTFAAMVGLMLAQVWLAQHIQMLHAGFRCSGYYARSTAFVHCLRLAEFAALVAAALTGGGPVACATAMVLAKTVGVIVFAGALYARASWLMQGKRLISFTKIRRLMRPGLMFVVFLLAGTLNVQTPLLVAGSLFGPSAVAVLSTARTMVRAVQQLLSVVGLSVWQETSQAFAAGDRPFARGLYRFTVAVSLWLGIAGALALAVAGPFVHQLWTGRLVPFDAMLFNLLLVALVCNALWFGASIIFSATNRHSGLAVASLIANLAVLPLSWLLTRALGLSGIPLALLLCELLIAAYVLPASLRLVGDSLGGLARAVIFPFRMARPLRADPQT